MSLSPSGAFPFQETKRQTPPRQLLDTFDSLMTSFSRERPILIGLDGSAPRGTRNTICYSLAMILRILMILSAGWLLGSTFALANDWKQYRGPHGDGTSSDTVINRDWKAKPPVLLWSYPLGDEGWGNPCVGDGRVFLLDHEGTKESPDLVRALDLETGRAIWNTPLTGPSQDKYGYTAQTPALDDGKLYCVSHSMQVSCLDAATGKTIWTRDASRDFSACPAEKPLAHTASPLVDAQHVYIVPGGPDASVVALDKNTGALCWKAPGGPAGYASPIFYGDGTNRQLVAFNSEGLIGFNPRDGRRLWTQPWITPHNQNAATPIVIGKQIFITSAWRVGAGLVDITDNKPSIVWKTKDLQARFTSPVHINGFIYGVSEPQPPGHLVCLDAMTGATKWKQPGFGFGPLGAVGDTLIVLNGNTGDIVLVEATSEAYRELGCIKSEKPTPAWNLPIVADGKLLFRNKKSLLCLNVAP
ncbi:MAG: PQQ-binding-like beta-propeller repeat protein [Verrucomicrobiae bacterium]